MISTNLFTPPLRVHRILAKKIQFRFHLSYLHPRVVLTQRFRFWPPTPKDLSSYLHLLFSFLLFLFFEISFSISIKEMLFLFAPVPEETIPSLHFMILLHR
ncbi:hypothetical protein CEXT_375251 [Caerostris extrusa]|uniref:Uncharacterized protein n=1 Tax=Caerostris extrusa TaxID=172846 RepID=A0AAV4T604_CAEEX|nr:hypothetical protein CEXT_375251 [Caerostris extrusa]